MPSTYAKEIVTREQIQIVTEIMNIFQDRYSVKDIADAVVRVISATPAAPEAPAGLKVLVDRFLGWPLPASVCSDLCVTDREYKSSRSGTNLLDVHEARQMLEYLGIDALLRRLAQAEEQLVRADAVIAATEAEIAGITLVSKAAQAWLEAQGDHWKIAVASDKLEDAVIALNEEQKR